MPDEIERQKMLRAQEAEPEPIIINRAELPCPHEAEVQALRDRVRELEQLLNSLMEPTKTTFGATLEGEATG